MAQGWPICSNCTKRNCRECFLAIHRQEPEHIGAVVGRVIAQIRAPEKETVKV